MLPGLRALHTLRSSRSWGTTRPASIESSASRAYSMGVSRTGRPATLTLRWA